MVSADNVSAKPPALEERCEAMTISRELELTAMHWTVADYYYLQRVRANSYALDSSAECRLH